MACHSLENQEAYCGFHKTTFGKTGWAAGKDIEGEGRARAGTRNESYRDGDAAHPGAVE
jgi:hypothetical protein